MKAKLEARASTPQFHIAYRLFARMTVSESTVRVSSISVSQTEAVLSLSGAGRAFRLDVSPTGGQAAVGSDQTYLTRDQAESFKARLWNEISADYIIERPEDLGVIRSELDRYFKKITQEREMPLNNLQTEMTKLSGYNFSAQDLSPAKIQKIAIDAKNYMSTEDSSKSSFNTSASASFFGFGGGASVGMSRESLKKNMLDKGWKFDVEVNAYVPISLKVHVLDRNALRESFSINISVSQRLRQITGLGSDVTTADGFNDRSAELGYKELTGQNYATELNKLSNNLAEAISSRPSSQSFAIPFRQGATHSCW
jgi:hypothetical protein